MSDKNVKIEGMDKVLDRLENLSSSANIQQALGQACALVERSAKMKAPKGDGHLRRSISSTVDANKLQGIVFTPLEYAPYVEYGTGLFAEESGRTDVPWHYQDDKGEWHSTSGMKPQPFMRPALEENRQAIKQKLKEGIK